MGLDLGKLGRELGLWNFGWSVEEREREAPKNLEDMARRTGRTVSIRFNSHLNSSGKRNFALRIEKKIESPLKLLYKFSASEVPDRIATVKLFFF